LLQALAIVSVEHGKRDELVDAIHEFSPELPGPSMPSVSLCRRQRKHFTSALVPLELPMSTKKRAREAGPFFLRVAD